MSLRQPSSLLSSSLSLALLAASLIATPGCGGDPEEDGATPPAPPAAPVVYDISLDTVRAKIMQWGFPARAAVPDAHLGDLFGVQRLSDNLTRAEVLHDRVPVHAEVVSGPSDPALRLRFAKRWNDLFLCSIPPVARPAPSGPKPRDPRPGSAALAAWW
jgi:hypothetical protein